MTMNNALKKLFGKVQAEEALKDHTRAFLVKQTKNYNKTYTKKRRHPAYAAACACLLLMLGGRLLYFSPTAGISIDINPSIELDINRFDRVIAVNSFNEDGAKLLSELDVKYKNYTEAVAQILNHDDITKLLSGDDVMTITVIGSDGEQSSKILSNMKRCTACKSNIDCYFAQSEDVAYAHKMGLSCGKYRAFLELQLLNADVTPETVQDMTMGEIQELIESLSVDDKIEN